MSITRILYSTVIVAIISTSFSCHAMMPAFSNITHTCVPSYQHLNSQWTTHGTNEFHSMEGDHVNVSTLLLMACIVIRFINPVRTLLSLCVPKD